MRITRVVSTVGYSFLLLSVGLAIQWTSSLAYGDCYYCAPYGKSCQGCPQNPGPMDIGCNGGAPQAAACQGPSITNVCMNTLPFDCGTLYFCKSGLATTNPPTSCMKQVQSCFQIVNACQP